MAPVPPPNQADAAARERQAREAARTTIQNRFDEANFILRTTADEGKGWNGPQPDPATVSLSQVGRRARIAAMTDYLASQGNDGARLGQMDQEAMEKINKIGADASERAIRGVTHVPMGDGTYSPVDDNMRDRADAMELKAGYMLLDMVNPRANELNPAAIPQQNKVVPQAPQLPANPAAGQGKDVQRR